jgi:hypothetical protein
MDHLTQAVLLEAEEVREKLEQTLLTKLIMV